MKRVLVAVAGGSAIGPGGIALAQNAYRGPQKVTTLSERDVIESLDGKEARVTTMEVTFEPGQAGLPHRHPGPILGYVLEGEFELALDEAPRRR
jgi:quercetin dioxygenase-like cupin family protein